jgi:hypothetical protein
MSCEMNGKSISGRRIAQKRARSKGNSTKSRTKILSDSFKELDIGDHLFKDVMVRDTKGIKRSQKSQRRLKRKLKSNAEEGRFNLFNGTTEDTYEVVRKNREMDILGIDEVDNADSYLLGEVSDFAVVNVARIGVALNKMAFWEVAAAIPFFAMSKRMPNSVIDVDGTDVGIFYLAAWYLAQDLLGACGGKISLLQEALVQYWEIRCAMTETERENFAFYFDVDQTPYVTGPHGLWPSGFPIFVGGKSLGWPLGTDSSGYDDMAYTIVNLTPEQVTEYGQTAVLTINAFLSGLGYELTECPAPNTEHGRYYESVGAFAMPEPSAGISCSNPTNTIPNTSFTSDERGSRLGVARLEVEFPNWQNWLAGLGLALFDETRTPPFTRELHMGPVNFNDRLYNNVRGRQGTFIECRVKQIQLETLIYDILNLFLAADVLRAQDRGEDPWDNNREINQWIGSALLSMTFQEFVNALALGITSAVQEWAFVCAGMTFIEGSVPIGVGACANSGFSSQQIPLPSQIIEWLRSIAPLCATSEEVSEKDGVRGKERKHYYVSVQLTALIEEGFGVEEDTHDLLLRLLNAHFGNISDTDYDFASTGVVLPALYAGPFDATHSYVEGPSVNDYLLKLMAGMGGVQAYICLENPNAEKNGPPNTLNYYTTYVKLYRADDGKANVLLSDYDRLLNRFPIAAKVIGWDASHLLQGVFEDPALMDSRQLSLALTQAYYEEPNSIVYERELTLEEYIALICQQYVYDRASFAAENAEDDKSAIIQHLGGGFFRALLGVGKKILGAVPAAVAGYVSGGPAGALAAGAGSLFKSHGSLVRGKFHPDLARIRLNLRYHDTLYEEESGA